MRVLRAIVRIAKKVPVDLGQYEMRYTTMGKHIGWGHVPDGNGQAALDLGCRDGYWSEKLAARGYQVTAVDLLPHYPKALTVDANLPLPFPDNAFDLVWSTEVIEHLIDPKFTVSEINRVLKHGGLLIMTTTPNIDCWIFRLLKALGISLDEIENEEHQHGLTFGAIRELLPGSTLYGYFPYVFVKRVIQRFAETLSPTIVAVFRNSKLDTSTAGSRSAA